MPSPKKILTPELEKEFLSEIKNNVLSLAALCQKNPHWPKKTWWRDLIKEDEVFADKYARAKEEQAELMAEEIIAIADDSQNDLEVRYGADGKPYKVEDKEVVNRSKLRVDTRKWLLSKLIPKKYGDKLDLNHSGDVTIRKVTVEIVNKPEQDEGSKTESQ